MGNRKKHSTSILTWNCRQGFGYKGRHPPQGGKRDLILQIMAEWRIKLAVITETGIVDRSDTGHNYCGKWRIIDSGRPTKPGGGHKHGGVAIVIASDLKYEWVKSWKGRLTAVDIKLGKHFIRLMEVYAPVSKQANSNLTEGMYDEISRLIASAPGKRYLICGDFNARPCYKAEGFEFGNRLHQKTVGHVNSSYFNNFMEAHGVGSLANRFRRSRNKYWTWRSARGKLHEIDHNIASPNLLRAVENCRPFGKAAWLKSDHRGLLCELKTTGHRMFTKKKTTTPRWKYPSPAILDADEPEDALEKEVRKVQLQQVEKFNADIRERTKFLRGTDGEFDQEKVKNSQVQISQTVVASGIANFRREVELSEDRTDPELIELRKNLMRVRDKLRGPRRKEAEKKAKNKIESYFRRLDAAALSRLCDEAETEFRKTGITSWLQHIASKYGKRARKTTANESRPLEAKSGDTLYSRGAQEGELRRHFSETLNKTETRQTQRIISSPRSVYVGRKDRVHGVQ